LSAYLLGELTTEDAAEIDRAVAADPSIRVTLDELQKTTSYLFGTFGGSMDQKLLPSQRQQVLRAGRDADQKGKVVELASARRSMRPWLTGLAAAAAITVAALVLNRMGGGGDGGVSGQWSDEIALLPMPGPSAGESLMMPGKGSQAEVEMSRQMDARGSAFLGEVARKLEQVRLPEVDRLPLATELSGYSNAPALRLPVVVGQSSPVWVNRWLQERDELPPKRLVRVEEFVNSVSLRHSEKVAGLGYAVELMDCPWKKGSRLVAVQLAAGAEDLSGLEVRSLSDVARRVVGSFSRRADSGLPAILPAGRSTLVLIELESAGEDPGTIELRHSNGMQVVALPADPPAPTPEMARAVAMAGYALWLRSEISDQELDATIASADEVDPGAVHREFRRGIERAKALAEAGR
jgi:hypothetical protein